MADLVIDNIKLSYGSVDILKGVSMTLEKGQIVALLGPSGSGKTTLLRCVAGLEEPYAGRIVIAGKTLFDGAKGINLPPEERGLGLVFQSYALWPHKTVFDNVAYPLKLRGVSGADVKTRVAKALESIGIGHLGARFPHQLSGGQQQRVALARALVYEPPVILLDEPLSNLDAKLREEARVWLRQLISELGLSALCVTHDQVEAMAMADRILLLNGGVVEQQGTPEEMYGRPATLFAAEFMGANNRLPGKAVSVSGDAATLVVGDTRLDGLPCGPVQEGDNALGIVRLEQVRVAEGPGPNRLRMTLTAEMYLGERYELLFKRDDVTVRIFSPTRIAGGEHWLEFPRSAFWVCKA
ncbi:ABC transporter ATP-binding protein [Alsobacter metallidurans]|uniref:ABC transporter ATP-binding protein n=1 Tax=Alsobacter metallidurans TaxID=340221 RepID=A0A917MJ69_9HYPH|nr:ABC transporter ATP-binding protein [Alsobacter metallidurans]GGH28906.1 ABC transporter ATP-binding protein [Alsobacter metallidurans]